MPGKNKSVSSLIKVKICGITNLDDALAVENFKADALGFVFYAKSPRYIRPHLAKGIISKLDKSIKKVGVFLDAKEDYVRKVAKLCNLNILQFHGSETPEFCKTFKGYKIIKAFRIKNKASLKDINRYKVDYYLFDTFKKGSPGGTGDRFNWSLVKNTKITRPFFLSGGLNPKNIQKAIKSVRPDWVDASSGLELSAGKKDHRLMREFIEKVKKRKRDGPA